MHKIYKIEGTEHQMHSGQPFLTDETWFPDFQKRLEKFKSNILRQVEFENAGKSYVHFGDGDYYFLKNIPIGSAKPGKRALSVPYNRFNIKPFKEGWAKADYHCVEYLEKQMRPKLTELYPNLPTIPTEYLYGLTNNKWFFKTFKGKIGLIGAGPKMDLIKELMKHEEYQEYLGLEKFNDYIKIPQKFACDNLENTINMVKEQLKKADRDTKLYLYGVGHVKSGLIHHLPSFKKAVYLDIGAGIDAIAGLLDFERPYAKGWINYRLKTYDYSRIDLLAYKFNKDRNLKIIE
jgi:hypothetical protein